MPEPKTFNFQFARQSVLTTSGEITIEKLIKIMNRLAKVNYGKPLNTEVYEKIKDIASKTSTPKLSKKSNHQDMFLAGSKATWGGLKNERNRFTALA